MSDYYSTAEASLASAQHEDEILAKEREKPRVGDQEDISVLAKEVAGGDPLFIIKAKSLAETYGTIRRVRKDGSCFLRAYLYGVAQVCMSDKTEVEKVLQYLDGNKAELIKTYGDHVEDFHDITNELFTDIKNNIIKTPEELHARFQDSQSDYVAYYGRFIASTYMRDNSDLFSPFLDVDIKTYCNTVETVGCELEHVSIMALTTALGTPVKIEYFDLSPGDKCNSHSFPEGSNPQIFLLYRPGHYDLLSLRK
eukprot:TRINITY_DN20465_c0_g1_i1.p1 TRINITY_DN20465_c0_g1~~TRINITY_DN20465_c0_g1_i1.p1  ORF type:complete len:253 (+),score=37.20 TRINITY_DN20465_c0_g1_i1:36-794(+)